VAAPELSHVFEQRASFGDFAHVHGAPITGGK
jgi:hypothetical protein